MKREIIFISLTEIYPKNASFWTQLLEKFKNLLFGTSFSKILFVLGGTDGFSEEIINLSNKQISLSKMTLTHSFAAIILLEQIYRSVTIKINHPYHRA